MGNERCLLRLKTEWKGERASLSISQKSHWSLVRELIQCRSLAFQANKTLLVDSGQDSIVLAQAFESLRFPLEQEESFSDLSCLTCAQQAVHLASSVSTLTSPCNERTWNAKGTDTIMTSPEREAPKTSTKRSAALDRRQELHLQVFIAIKGGQQACTTFTSCQNAAG